MAKGFYAKLMNWLGKLFLHSSCRQIANQCKNDIWPLDDQHLFIACTCALAPGRRLPPCFDCLVTYLQLEPALHATSSEFNARHPSSLPWITFWRLRVVDNTIRLLDIHQNFVFGDKSRIALCYLTRLALTVVRLMLHLRRFLFSNAARLKPAFGFWLNKRIFLKEQR